jgi:uncharacterized Zn finger protein (UPF0148 family)
MKITTVICPACNEGVFKMVGGKEKCTVCGAPLTDETIEKELDKAWAEHLQEEKQLRIEENIKHYGLGPEDIKIDI